MLESAALSFLSQLTILLSIALWFLYFYLSQLAASAGLFRPELAGQFDEAVTSPDFWLLCFLLPVASLVLDIFFSLVRSYRTRKVLEVNVLEDGLIEEMDPLMDVSADTLRRMTQTLPKNKSKAQLDELESGFAFSETKSRTVCESDCVEAYSKTLNRPKCHRPSMSRSRRMTIT